MKNPAQARAYIAYVSGQPQEKPKSISCPVILEKSCGSLNYYAGSHKILLYLSKDSLSRKVSYGDRLIFYSGISAPRNNGNPEEFDYARFLFHRQISGTTYVSSGKWKLLPQDDSFDLKQIAFLCREKVLAVYRRLGFEEDNFAVLSALTLGYKEELTDEIRQAYSISGVSHVLALSGLHIGLLYVLLDFILGWADRKKSSRFIKQLFIIACLWAFAFVTGLFPSVIRSVGMFSIVAFSGIFSGRSVTLNTLAVAAFLMLLYDPFYLYDVSFQLSFLSVAGIVVIQPWLYHKWSTGNRVLQYLWGLVTVSVAAQLATAPLIMYYFSTFPVHFLWTNILVIPLVTLILYLAVVMLAFSFFPLVQSFIALALVELICFLNAFTLFVGHLPGSSVNNIRFTQSDVLGFYLLFVLVAFYLLARKWRTLVAAFSCLLIFSTCHLRRTLLTKTGPAIVFYNNRICPSVHFINSRERSYLLSVRQDSVIENLRYAAGRFWVAQRLCEPVVLPSIYENAEVLSHQGITNFAGKTVCLVNDHRWLNKEAGKPLSIDYLYLCNGYRGHIGQLMKLFTVRKVVLDSSLSGYRLAILKEECGKLGLDFISISEKGSYHIGL